MDRRSFLLGLLGTTAAAALVAPAQPYFTTITVGDILRAKAALAENSFSVERGVFLGMRYIESD